MTCKAFIILMVVAFTTCSCLTDSNSRWESLLDHDLSKWEIYLSYKHKSDYNGEVPKSENGEALAPIGYNKNVNNVFSVIEEDGKPVLRISGEIYGAIFTKQEFENYHLKLKVRFGTKKWGPRIDMPMDSGLLYHSHGESGVDYWRSWMQAHEFQIMEGGFGDYWCIASTGAKIKMQDPEARNDIGAYDSNGILTPMGVGGTRTGFVQHSINMERPGAWNSVELIAYGNKSLHIVNGQVVMAISNSIYKDGEALKPLVKGKIQLQSEAAEVFYKDIQIRKIEELPQKYTDLFSDV